MEANMDRLDNDLVAGQYQNIIKFHTRSWQRPLPLLKMYLKRSTFVSSYGSKRKKTEDCRWPLNTG